MPFVSKESFQQLNSENWTAAELQNPINENEPFLRGSLFKSLFSAINKNVKKGYSSIKVFEAGNVFKKEKRGFAQSLNLSGIVYHHEPNQSWSQHLKVSGGQETCHKYLSTLLIIALESIVHWSISTHPAGLWRGSYGERGVPDKGACRELPARLS